MLKKKLRYKKRPKENILSTMCVIVSITLIVGVLASNLFLDNNTKSSKVNTVMPRVAENKKSTKKNDNPNEKDTMSITSDEKKDNSEKSSKKSEDKEQASETEKTKTTMASESVDLSGIIYPVESEEIIMDYSYNKEPVYSVTFEEYRSDHTGIDFSAKKGENVKAVFEGEVVKSYKDEKVGYTVIIRHSGNIYSVYSNLNKRGLAKKGDTVKKGDTIGEVSNSASYEIAEDYHVHFEMKQGKKYIDPKKYLK